MSSAEPAPDRAARPPAWVLGLLPLVLVAALVAVLFAVGVPGGGDRVPREDLVVERTVLRPGSIELSVRNDGPDAVRVAQVVVNDAYVPTATVTPPEVDRLGSMTVRIPYDWIEGEAYGVSLITSAGGAIDHAIDVAQETPSGGADLLGLLGLLGLLVGVVPVSVGMLWLPFVRRARPGAVRFLLALTVGLLAFLAADALVEGIEVAGGGPQAFGGPALVLVGAVLAFVALSAVDAWISSRRGGSSGFRLALLVAVGIGLHNLGEGLAIGSAYAIGELALGAFLVVGFALHNTTEGLAVVAPFAHERAPLGRLLMLGLVAGAPAAVGAWVGGAAYSPALAGFLLGFGAGAILQVVLQMLPSLRPSRTGRAITPLTAGGLAAGMAVMYVTGLLVAV